MNKLIYILSIGILLTACKKDSPEQGNISSINVGSGGVLIGSEGNFQFGNASLSHYDDEKEEITADIFESTNGYKLGDVLQSIQERQGLLYLVMNNSSTVQVIDKYTFASKGSITGFNSPRYFLPVSNSKAYVTDLYANSISIVDLNTLESTKSIQVNGWTEELVMIYGKVFVCNKGNDQVYVIEAETDLLVDSITVSDAPTSILEDKNGLLWVLCKNSLHKIDPVSLSLSQSYALNTSSYASQLKINGTGDTLYFLNNGVFQFPIGDSTIPGSPIIEAGSTSFYGLGVDPVSGDIYVSDAIDYIQKSKIFLYTSGGALKSSFLSGINTSFFYF